MNKIAEKLDLLAESLKDKTISIPVNLAGGGVFFLLGLILLVIIPSQVRVAARDVVNGRVFPSGLVVLMMVCSAGLIGKDLVLLARKKPVFVKTLNLLTEIKVLVILCIFLLTFLLCRLTGSFVAGACFCCLGFMVYFQCKKPGYYVITLASAVLIWASFRFFLGVTF
jgi:hypothetical protein